LAFIEITGVSKSYGRRDVLHGVSLSVERGEFVSVVGSMGCGKSTLLNIVAGLTSADAGQVVVDGQPLRGIRKDAAVVFQNYSLLPWFSALENVRLAVGAAFPDWTRSRQREQAVRHLESVGLGRAVDRRPGHLSGGMRQRVAIARALALGTPILLMDEPFGALDEQTRLLMGEWLVEIRRRTARTIVFVTHSLYEAIALSDRIAVMTARPGRIKDVLEVSLPYPRALDAPEAVDLHAKLWAQLREESLRAMDGQR